MFKRHHHEWEEVYRSYHDPIVTEVVLDNIDNPTILKRLTPEVVCGSTNIYYKCECGKKKQEHLIGIIPKV